VTITATPTISVTSTVTPTNTITQTATITPSSTFTPTPVLAISDLVLFYPNPARIGDTAYFRVGIQDNMLTSAGSCPVAITIYNVVGEKIAVITVSGQSGINRIAFETNGFAGGIYYYRTTLGDTVKEIKKLVLIKY
jgi:hypothetical protein